MLQDEALTWLAFFRRCCCPTPPQIHRAGEDSESFGEAGRASDDPGRGSGVSESLESRGGWFGSCAAAWFTCHVGAGSFGRIGWDPESISGEAQRLLAERDAIPGDDSHLRPVAVVDIGDDGSWTVDSLEGVLA